MTCNPFLNHARPEMSRLTASDVIDQGKYLDANFDPTTLTIPHLTAILNYHNIDRPPQANKGKLVQAFNDEIVPRREQYLAERRDMEGSEASAVGISDGMTGEPLIEPVASSLSMRCDVLSPTDGLL